MEAAACFVWNPDPVAFTLGPLTIRWYGIFFGLVFLVGYHLIGWQFKRANYPQELNARLVMYIFFGMLIGAYLGHRIFYEWDRLVKDPLSVFSFQGGISGLSSHGATVGILLSTYLFSLRTKMRYVEMMDRMIFAVTLGAIMVRLGNFMNSEIVGRTTDSALAVCFPRFDNGLMVPRHPSQLYEAGMGIVVMLVLFVADRLAGREKRPLGLLVGLFMTVYFLFRFIVEFFKEFQTLSPDAPLTMGQWLSFPFFFVGVWLLWRAYRHPQPALMALPEHLRKLYEPKAADGAQTAKGGKASGRPPARDKKRRK